MEPVLSISGSLTSWSHRSLSMSHSRRSWKIVHIIVILLFFLDDSECDSDTNIPVINRCCPVGFVYHDDRCLTSNLTIFPSSSNSSSSSTENSAYSNEWIADVINITSRSVLPIPASVNLSVFHFRLEDHLPSETCGAGSFIKHMLISPSNESNKSPKEDLNDVYITSRGELKVGNEYYSTPEFCLISIQEGIASIRVCNATCLGNVPCIRKCCDLNEAWSFQRGRSGCFPAGSYVWAPDFYETPTRQASAEVVSKIHPHYTVAEPSTWCKRTNETYGVTQGHVRLGSGRTNWKFRLGVDGSIYRRMSRYTWKAIQDLRGSTCLDGSIQWSNESGTLQPLFYSGIPDDDVIYECITRQRRPPEVQYHLYGICMIVSCVFLSLTLLVHFLLWEKQTVHGWTLMSYCGSLLFMYLFFAMDKLSAEYTRKVGGGKLGTYCEFVGVSANFFFVLSFCWMTVINFDLWLTFKKLKPPSGRSRGLKRYLLYAGVAIALPVAIVTTAVTLDSIYGDDPESGVIVPEYARKGCLLDPEYGQLVYQHGPAGVLLVFNVLFFVGTVYSIHKAQRNSKFASSSSSKNSQQRSRLRLFAKLLFAMGIPWVFEIISWLVERDNPRGNSWYFVLFDLINVLQGAFIFFIFVFKKDVLHSLDQKYPKLKGFRNRFRLDAETGERIIQRCSFLKCILNPMMKGKASPTNGRSGATESSAAENSNSSNNTGSPADIELKPGPDQRATETNSAKRGS